LHVWGVVLGNSASLPPTTSELAMTRRATSSSTLLPPDKRQRGPVRQNSICRHWPRRSRMRTAAAVIFSRRFLLRVRLWRMAYLKMESPCPCRPTRSISVLGLLVLAAQRDPDV